jgi:UDP-N-acetylmuramate-alanine ligase
MLKLKFKNAKSKAALALSLVAGSSFVTQAADYTTQITAAGTDGTTNVTAVIAAVIGIAILGFGVASMLGWFRK